MTLKRNAFMCLCALLLGANIGCLSDHHAREQKRLRQVVIELYEEQLLDNLVRVREYRPIIQLTYTNMTGLITDKVGLEGSGSQSDAAGTITNMFTYKGSANRASQLSVTANPVVDGGKLVKVSSSINKGDETAKFDIVPSIYQNYIDFVFGRQPKAKSLPESRRNILESFKISSSEEMAEAAPSPTQFNIPELSSVPQYMIGKQKDGPSNKSYNAGALPSSVRALIPKLLVSSCDPEENPEPGYVTIETLTGAVQVEFSGRAHISVRRPSEEFGKCFGQDCCKKNGKYIWYWVPTEFRNDYLRLAMQTTAGYDPAANVGGNAVVNELTLNRLRN